MSDCPSPPKAHCQGSKFQSRRKSVAAESVYPPLPQNEADAQMQRLSYKYGYMICQNEYFPLEFYWLSTGLSVATDDW